LHAFLTCSLPTPYSANCNVIWWKWKLGNFCLVHTFWFNEISAAFLTQDKERERQKPVIAEIRCAFFPQLLTCKLIFNLPGARTFLSAVCLP
jgi:hypothetical protein